MSSGFSFRFHDGVIKGLPYLSCKGKTAIASLALLSRSVALAMVLAGDSSCRVGWVVSPDSWGMKF